MQQLSWCGTYTYPHILMSSNGRSMQKFDIDPEQQLYTPKIVDIAADVMEMHEGLRKCGQVGPPIYGARIKMDDWEEGGYRVTDHPNPRGELLVGTSFAPNSYYKKPELGKDTFLSIDGMTYCRTGDIAEYLPDGTFKIIDRKKDLVKLQFGEYVSLGKVESELKTSPLVDNILACGNGYSRYLVVLVSPNKDQLGQVARGLDKAHLTFEDQCEDDEIVKACTESLREHAKKGETEKYVQGSRVDKAPARIASLCPGRLHGAEVPAKVKLCCEAWTREKGLVTAAFKVRRKVLEQHYREDIDKMYQSLL
ncbi:ACSL4 [Cordylochernes scorpioides]|uniref:ACSL4 n=1 Tax=Cordylochernes scorpioides TaxID=51811 RepID=A0ABY6KYR1_9ARAC|nr:ACSL4 [Cordylochernes scorpioides]